MWFKREKEMSLKQELEESIQTFFEFHDEFSQKKTKLESGVFDHLSRVSISNRWASRGTKKENRRHRFEY